MSKPSKKGHLSDMTEFVESFAAFREALRLKKVKLEDKEHEIRLFDIWLANFKDEKVLNAQMDNLREKDPWET